MSKHSEQTFLAFETNRNYFIVEMLLFTHLKADQSITVASLAIYLLSKPAYDAFM